MLSQRVIETCVGIFLLAAIAGLVILAFKVSGLTSFFQAEGYTVHAMFDDIGSLKVRSAVKIGGVNVGEVSNIHLDPTSFKAVVDMRIHKNVNAIPTDSTANILTAGLLGDNYIEIIPMYSTEFLKEGGEIQDTHSAMILEKLIGQLMFKISGSSTANSNANASTDAATPDTTNTTNGAKK